MKRILRNITVASLITLVAYIALNTFWRAILSMVQNESLRLFLIALMTAVAFDFVLLYVSKIRNGDGEGELSSDYEERTYSSFAEDLKLVLRRESKVLIAMVSIVFVCFLLNAFDSLVLQKKFVSLPAVLFAPLCLFSSWVKIPFVGYLISAAVDCVGYIAVLLFWRKKKYREWTKNKG